MDLVDLIEQKRFLGGEFLVWLWNHQDTKEGRFSLGEHGDIILAFDDQIVLEALLADAEKSRLSGGAPCNSPEARTALRAGKHLSKAKMRLLQDDREWVFTVTASDFYFSSVKVPAVLKGEDEKLLERLALIDDLNDMWLAVYRIFLTERLGPEWKSIESELTEWASGAHDES